MVVAGVEARDVRANGFLLVVICTDLAVDAAGVCLPTAGGRRNLNNGLPFLREFSVVVAIESVGLSPSSSKSFGSSVTFVVLSSSDSGVVCVA